MKIQAEVSLYVQLADGRRVSVAHTVNRTAGDNPAYAVGEALHALTEAQTAALRGFATQIRPDGTLPESPTVAPLDGVGRIVALLDQFGVADRVSVSGAKAIVRQAGADPMASDEEWREAVRIRHARKDPER